MANNFADDARIIEFWRFENNLSAETRRKICKDYL